MNPVIVNSKVGADGILQVQVPLGAAEANREVRVTIEASAALPVASDDYVAWLRSVAGHWQGEFERPSQGMLEERQPLS